MNKNDFHKWVGYQIYPKSFKDTNADGLGDLPGIIEKLPYLKKLGVDFLWLNPIYRSPQVDGGYDISDYYAIDEMFGSLDDFHELLDAAHENGLKIIMDLVVNHSSDQHPWFIESRKSRQNTYRDYYHWADATPEEMPNDWRCFFGGSAWTYDARTQQAYFHVFGAQQPDLNWENPKLRAEIYQMIRYWLELGVDGFRLDAISHIKKAPWDFKIKSWQGDGPWQPFMNVPGIEKYLHELKEIFDEYGALTVGEASGISSQEAPDWTDKQAGYMDMIFELEQNKRRSDGSGDVYGFKKTLMRWQEDMQSRGWLGLYLENHDIVRSIDVFGNGTLASAKALAVAYMLLRGTPFIYQGQEIGMHNFPFDTIKQLRSAELIQHYQELLTQGLTEQAALQKVSQNSREHARTPMQWDDSAYAGFSTAPPWMAVNPDYPQVNAQQENELFKLYEALIALRHKEKAISDGAVKFHFVRHLQAFVYERDEFLILVNLGPRRAHLDLTKILSNLTESSVRFDSMASSVLSSQPRLLKKKMILDPWEYQVFRRKK